MYIYVRNALFNNSYTYKNKKNYIYIHTQKKHLLKYFLIVLKIINIYINFIYIYIYEFLFLLYYNFIMYKIKILI